MKPINVRLQNCSTQSGIDRNPIICWEYGAESAIQVQSCCRIYIRQGEQLIYDSKEIKTKHQSNHQIQLALETHRKYHMTVAACDQTGNWEKSEEIMFISGICQPSDWAGGWISNGTCRPHYLGTEILLEKPIESAVISLAGVGQYELKINKTIPDNSVLKGSWTDFNKHIHYQTYEIGELLHQGENGITIEVGNGWYCADVDERHFYTWDMGYEAFGKSLCAKASITIRYKDGEYLKISSDDAWWSKPSETTYTNVYGSEDYDARAFEKKRTQAVLLSESEIPKGTLIPMNYPPVAVKKVYHGTLLQKQENGSCLYDLGQNMSGLFEITVRGECGTKLQITPVEKLDDYGKPWKTVETWCTYILCGEKSSETWKPQFTYGAGRYIQINLASDSEGKRMPEILEVRGYFITSSAENTGEFSCSDYRYMQIHDLVLRAIESNLNHVHTDCPTIERLGWQEPNHLMGPSIMYVKDVDTLWNKIAMDLRDSQYEEKEHDIDQGEYPHVYGSGLITSIAPRYARFLKDCGEGSFWDIIPWGSSILLAAYEQYRFYGNKATLIENYEASKKYVDYLYQKYCSYSSLYEKSGEERFLRHGLGDWGIKQNKGESRENIETAYLYRDMIVLSEVAGWIGKEDETYYKSLAEEIKTLYNQLLLVINPKTGEWVYRSYDKAGIIPTQATQATPLCFGMVPEEKRESVQKSFLITCKDHVLQTGEIGLPYILRTLGEMNQCDIVHDMILNVNHPGYYRFIQNGETTLPEFWRDDARSRNHDMMGAVLEWFYRYLAGISSEDGFNTIKIKPLLPQEISYVKCAYRSIKGKIEVEICRLESKQIQLKVQIPINTCGHVFVNEIEESIEGGQVYRF